MKSKLINFWAELLLKPKLFFKKNLRHSKIEPAYYSITFSIYCLGHGIDWLDRQLMKLDFRGKLEDAVYINNWIVYWLLAIIGGLIGGFILYHIGGWFFNVRLKWSKGTSDIDKSKHIYLYSGVIPSFFVVSSTLISMAFNNSPYISESELSSWNIILLVLLLFFSYYSIYISYCGVRSITDADNSRSKLWFLFLPISYFTIMYIAVFIMLLKLGSA